MIFKKNISRGLTTLLIAGNVLVLYYLIPIDFILKSVWVLLGIASILLFTGFLASKKNIKYLNPLNAFRATKHSLGISKEMFKVNKKYVILSIITLTIAVASISQAVIISEGVQRQYVVINSDKYDLPTLVVNAYSPPSLPPEKVYYRQITPEAANRIDEMVKAYKTQVGIHTRILRQYTVALMGPLYTKDNYGTYESIMIGMSKELMEDIWGTDYNGIYPRDNSSVLAIVYPYELPDRQPEWFLGKSINVQSIWKNQWGNEEKMYGFWNVSGYKIINSASRSSFLPYGIGDVPPIIYVVPFEHIDAYRKVYEDTVAQKIICSYYFDWQSEPDIITFSKKIGSLGNEIMLHSTDLEGPYPEYQLNTAQSPIQDQLNALGSIITQVRAILMLFLIPIVIVGIFLASFALNIAEQKRKKLIAMFKSRGVSSQQLKGALTIEALFTGLGAYLLGILLAGAILVIFLLLSSLSLVKYALPAFKTSKLWLSSLLFSIILSLDTTWNKIRYLSEIDVEQAEQLEVTSVPFWRKYFLDLFLLLLGLLGLVGLKILSSYHSSYVNTEGFVLIFSPLVILLLFLGGTMTFYRFFIPFTNIIAKFLFNLIGSISGMGLRSIRLRKEKTSQIAAILMLSSLFALLLVIIPPTLNTAYNDQVHYIVGSDIRVSSLSDKSWNGTDYSIVNKTNDIEALAGGILIEVKVKNELGDYITFRILGVDPEHFFDAAFFRSDFTSYPTEQLKDYLLENQSNAIIWSNDKKIMTNDFANLTALDRINRSKYDTYIFNTKLTFDYWPILLKQKYTELGFRIVTNINRTLEIFHSISSMYISRFDLFLLVKTSPTANLDSLASKLRIETSLVGDPIVYTVSSIGLSSKDVALDMAMPYMARSGLVILLIIVFTGMLLFGVANVNTRKDEISLLKVLGMVKTQLIRLFMSETFYIALISVTTGYFVGTLFAPMFIDLVHNSGFFSQYPPIIQVKSILLEKAFYSSVFMLTALSSFIPIMLMIRLKPDEIFRKE